MKPRNLREALMQKGIDVKGVLSSYDLVGDSAVVQVPEGIDATVVAECISRIHKNVKRVYKKVSPVKGSYRVKELELVWGSDGETHYKENGVSMVFDLKRVFFSPRLSTERKRVSELVKPNENVLVLFAGVGPFALVIARKCKDCSIVGVEINPVAVEYFRRNINLNKFSNVDVVLGDVSKVVEEKFKGWPDRVVMPLPKDAEHFLRVVERISRKGTVVHFYTFVERSNVEQAVEKIRNNFSRPFKVLFLKKLRDYSATTVQVVVDFEVVG